MKIGIIGAFDEEIEKFIEMFNLDKDENNNREVYLGNFKDKKLVIARSGVGKVNSGAMTQFLIDKYDVDLIINSGCAGSLTKDNNIMDVIISSYVVYHDFTPNWVMEKYVPDHGHIEADKRLINLAVKVLNDMNDITYHVGAICSGDCFVTDTETRDKIRNSTGAIAVDMESGSIGHISKLNNIPFLSIRTISDFADGVDDEEAKAAYKSSNLVKEIISQL